MERLGGRGWYDPKKSRPSPQQAGRIVSMLRGNFEYAVKPRNDVQAMETSLATMTEEQYDALDAVQDNARIVFKGLAGTGKTFLALEAARRACRSGRRTLLVCYNRLLACWMKRELARLSERERELICCLHFHGLLRDIVGKRIPFRDHRDFWGRELPEHAIDRLLADDRDYPQFDLLVIDEAQDLLTDEYLDVFDLLVSGGIAGGHWLLFGDFERQAIYLAGGSLSAVRMLDCLRERAPNHVSFNLRINCRNAGRIAEAVTLACHIQPGYSRFLHDMEGASVDPWFWGDQPEQAALLMSCLDELRKSFTPEEITVLSMKSDDNSCAMALSHSGHGGKLIPLREDLGTLRGATSYTTIHAFKGLEAPAVILTDIDFLDDLARSLLYVGMSRARICLVLLMHTTCRKEYMQMLDSGLGSATRR